MSGIPVDYDPFADGEVAATAPATAAQIEIWTASQLGDEASLAFNESVSLRFTGAFDEAAMREALGGIWRRHEALRATISDDGRHLVIAAPSELAVRSLELDAAGYAALLRAEVTTPFDLHRGPLFRATIVRLGPDRHDVVLTAHHIVCDGWSFAVLFQDLGALYSAHHEQRAAELPPALRFTDYALAERDGRAGDDDEPYWLAQFQGTLPVLDLPLDRPRPKMRTTRSGRVDHELSAELVAALKKVGAKAGGASFFVTLFAAFDAFMYRISGQGDLVVGVPAAGQSATGQEMLVGHCANLLPVRAAVRGGDRFSDFLKAHRKTVLDTYDHQRYTLGRLMQKLKVARDPSRLTLVPLLFNLDASVEGAGLRFSWLEVDYVANPRSEESFELFLNCVESRKRLRLECQYNADLFDEASVHAWLAGYEALLAGVVAAPDTTIDELPVVAPADRARQLEAWQGAAVLTPDLGFHELIEAQVDRTPDAPAVRGGGASLTYAQLDARANQLAHALRARGVRSGALVGVAMERGADLVVALLGILKAGAAYVPLDPEFPRDRLAFMVSDSKLALVVADEASGDTLPGDAARLGLEEIAEQPATRLAGGVRPDDAAYVIYTSGSTGQPKGVVLPHRAVVNFLLTMRERPGMAADDVLVAVTTISFDIAVLELYLPLIVGAQVVIADRDTASDGGALAELLEAAAATTMQATPSTWRGLLAAGYRRPLRVLCGGEALPRDLADELVRRFGRLWNLYGPTETCVWSTCAELDAVGAPITIGRPIGNTRVYIVDDALRLRPAGVPGELCIGGAGVATGYLGRAELTAERFVANPFAPGRLYRTGDLVRWRHDGTLEYQRRNDTQVKVRGHRIELGEIESALATHPAVKQGVASVVDAGSADARIVAYVVPAGGGGLTITELRKHLRKKLPDYMIPHALVELPALPLTPNGKIARSALPRPGAPRVVEEHVPPRTDAERLVAEVWARALNVPRVSVHENFFDLGGHSLLAMEVIGALAEKTGRRLSPRLLLLSNLADVAREVGS